MDKDRHANVPLADIAEALERRGVGVVPCAVVAEKAEAERTAGQYPDGPLWIKSAGEGHSRFCMQLEHRADLPLGWKQARGRGTIEAVVVQPAVSGTVYRIHADRRGVPPRPIVLRAELSAESHYRIVESLTLDAHLGEATRAPLLSIAGQVEACLDDARAWSEVEIVWTREGPKVTDLWLSEQPTVIAEALRSGGLERVLLGEQDTPALCVAWLRSRSGVIERIDHIDAAAALPGIRDVVVHARPGETIGHVIDKASRDRLGYVLASGPDAATAEARAHAAREHVVIVTRIALD